MYSGPAQRQLSRHCAAMPDQARYMACSPRNTGQHFASRATDLSFRSFELSIFLLVFRNTLQPDLAPVGIDCARTEATANRIAGFTDNILQNDRIGFKPDHSSSPLIDDLFLSTSNLVFALGERHHFGIKIQSSIPIVGVQRLQYF